MVIKKCIKIDSYVAVFNVEFNGLKYILKCSPAAFYEASSYGRERFIENKFSTTIQREAEGFKIVNSMPQLNEDVAKMYAYGNLWVDNNSMLHSCVEVILIQEIAGYTCFEVMYPLVRNHTADNLVNVFVMLAAVFKSLYKLHTNGVFHGDANLGNVVFQRNRKLCWIDFSRTKKNKTNFNSTTWNVLKLIDINVLLSNLMQMYIPDFMRLDKRIFRSKLPKDHQKIFLPHECYSYDSFIHDNTSCNALNWVFKDHIDLTFLSNPKMSDESIFQDLTDTQKLINMVNRYYIPAAKDTPNESMPSPYNEYHDYSFVEDSKVKSQISKTNKIKDKEEEVKPVVAIKKATTHQAIQDDLHYDLILSGQQIYSEVGTKLVYHRIGNKYFVKRLNASQDDVVAPTNDTLYVTRNGDAMLYKNGKQCFYSIRENLLFIKSDTYVIRHTYDLRYTPPKEIKSVNMEENPGMKSEKSTTDLIIEGEQYYSRFYTKFQVMNDGGKYILCTSEPNKGLIRLPADKLNVVFIKHDDKFFQIQESIPYTTALQTSKTVRAIQLSSQGILDIIAVNQSEQVVLRKYNITTHPYSYMKLNA